MPQTVLYVGTYGPEDPTRATLLFAAAIGMKRKSPDNRVVVALLGQGIHLIHGKTADTVKVSGVSTGARQGYDSIGQMMAAAIDAKVEIHC